MTPDALLDLDEVMFATLLEEQRARDEREVKLHGG
jgi:hypothetical protein